MSRHAPPRLANWLIGRVLPEKDREAVLGDLAEEFALRTRSASTGLVSRWYWGQVCRSVPPVVWSPVRRGRWLPTLAVAIGAYVAAGMVEAAGDLAISKLLGLDARMNAIVGLIFGLTTMALGGYLAAWIRPGAAAALAGIVLISVAMLMVIQSDSVPLWYQWSFLIVGPLASWAGGTLFLRRRAVIGWFR